MAVEEVTFEPCHVSIFLIQSVHKTPAMAERKRFRKEKSLAAEKKVSSA